METTLHQVWLLFGIIAKIKIVTSLIRLKNIQTTIISQKKWTDKSGQEHISKDIELLLSRCDTFLSLKNLSNRRLDELKNFVKDAKLEILNKTNFTGDISDAKSWEHHNKLLRVLGKRTT